MQKELMTYNTLIRYLQILRTYNIIHDAVHNTVISLICMKFYTYIMWFYLQLNPSSTIVENTLTNNVANLRIYRSSKSGKNLRG